MRIISQDGFYNLNYDNIRVMKCNHDATFGITSSGSNNGSDLSKEVDIAWYSDESQRDIVFEQIILSGASDVKIFRVPEDVVNDPF